MLRFVLAHVKECVIMCDLAVISQDPRLLGVEWQEGPPSLYVTPARDAVLAAVLDAAQVSMTCEVFLD